MQTHGEITRFAICNEACPKRRRVACTKDSEYLTFSDDNSDSGEDHRQQERTNVDCNPTFDASCSSSEPNLLTQGDLNDLEFV
jgi:hypothetical protein